MCPTCFFFFCTILRSPEHKSVARAQDLLDELINISLHVTRVDYFESCCMSTFLFSSCMAGLKHLCLVFYTNIFQNGKRWDKGRDISNSWEGKKGKDE